MARDFEELTRYAKSFSGLTPELESLLAEAGAEIKPNLGDITENFYEHLLSIPEAKTFLENRVESLKTTHKRWLEGLFTGPYDQAYTEHMYKVGDVHVKVNLPVEFMAGAMTLINNRLIELVVETFGDDPKRCSQILVAISAITGMSLLIMQQSYQEASLAEELEKFLKISGMSRTLFTNLAAAYKDK
ncbi:MAG: protoglobin domain-containing protein [Gammaproteobacteria bacterium]